MGFILAHNEYIRYTFFTLLLFDLLKIIVLGLKVGRRDTLMYTVQFRWRIRRPAHTAFITNIFVKHIL